MSPLVFTLLFVILESLVLIVAGAWFYARHKARLDEIDHAGVIPSRPELAERLIAAHEAIQKSARKPGAEQMLGAAGRDKVIETLRGLAVRLACNDSVSPLYADQMIRLCTELAGAPPVAAENHPEPDAEHIARPADEAPADAPAEPAQN